MRAHRRQVDQDARRLTKTRQWVNRQFTKIDADLERCEENRAVIQKMTWLFPIPRRIAHQATATVLDEIGAITRKVVPERWYDPRTTTVSVQKSGRSAILTIAFSDYP